MVVEQTEQLVRLKIGTEERARSYYGEHQVVYWEEDLVLIEEVTSSRQNLRPDAASSNVAITLRRHLKPSARYAQEHFQCQK
ncbi:hypothetical protein G5714_016439 [Onychostoma macrolepis]|uniref:Uncharacterized protein n=1 Tax=Onychostoma macrolepis TaxID=369639 RepID=A0A7J6C8M9_9TELE|nr:hypothetical protein G5714_016439 [Onychostoma macrolepis]